MPHTRNRTRNRYIQHWVHKLAKLWPVVGVYGLRQVGKSTLLRDLCRLTKSEVSLYDEATRSLAESSSANFLSRFEEPLLIDEIQKTPKLFDAIKLSVDQKRVPGRFFITGSMEFSQRVNIRESLTGRIGLVQLYPMTLGESHDFSFEIDRNKPFHVEAMRLSNQNVSQYLSRGGMPTPMFLRDDAQRTLYFQSWVETTIFRDAARAYGRNYDPEFAFRLIQDIAALHANGIYPTTSQMRFDARKVKKYIQAFCDVFLLNRILIHEAGVGKDVYLLSDCGIASYLMGSKAISDSGTRSLLRILILNEILALNRYQGNLYIPLYYKSQKGEPVDLIWNNTPIVITTEAKINEWALRPLRGAMQKLSAQNGIVVGPFAKVEISSKGVSFVPWSFWS